MGSRTEYDKRYRQSEKGKACTERYNHSAKGQDCQRRHQLTDKWLAKHLKCAYGMSLDDYYKLSKEQNNVCAICGQKNYHNKRLCVDHDHETGVIRGLLCTHCNALLGHARDDIVILKRAMDYLQ